MERITTQCACGHPLTAYLLVNEVRLYTRVFRRAGGRTVTVPEPRRVTRCPSCDRDFSGVAVDQIKSQVWGS